MLNGYSPNVSQRYIDEVFYRFESINRGFATEEQLDGLLAMGIHHLVLHEDAFPERVSPFGVAQTLKGFLEHPRIRLLAQDRAVWAFEIMEDGAEVNVIRVPWDQASVTYAWDAERIASEGADVHTDAAAHGGRFVRLSETGQEVRVPDWGIHHVETLRLSARVRGEGVLRAGMVLDSLPYVQTFALDTQDWIWLDIPYPAFEGHRKDLQFRLAAETGAIDVDYVYVAQGQTPASLEIGHAFRMPAPTLFRAGYTDLARNEVILRPDLVPANYILYGPRLPLPVGRYVVRLVYRSESDTELGAMGFRYPGKRDNPGRVSVRGADGIAEIEYIQTANLPVTMEFLYNRAAGMTIHALEIERIE